MRKNEMELGVRQGLIRMIADIMVLDSLYSHSFDIMGASNMRQNSIRNFVGSCSMFRGCS